MIQIYIYKLKLLLRSIYKSKAESIAKVVVGFVVLSFFSGGGFALFYNIFAYLKDVQDIGAILSDKLISVGFLAFGLMLFVSNFVSGISTLYKSTETQFLISSPINHRSTFWLKFSDNIFFSSWATVVIGIPLFLAYSIVFEISWYYFVSFCFLGLPAFLIIPACFRIGFSILFFLMAKKMGYRNTIIAAVFLSILSLFFYIRQNELSGILLNIQGDLNILNYYLSNLASSKSIPLAPWDLISQILKTARWADSSKFIVNLSLLLSTSMFCLVILDYLSGFYYYKAFLASSEITTQKTKKKRRMINKCTVFSGNSFHLLINLCNLYSSKM